MIRHHLKSYQGSDMKTYTVIRSLHKNNFSLHVVWYLGAWRGSGHLQVNHIRAFRLSNVLSVSHHLRDNISYLWSLLSKILIIRKKVTYKINHLQNYQLTLWLRKFRKTNSIRMTGLLSMLVTTWLKQTPNQL